MDRLPHQETETRKVCPGQGKPDGSRVIVQGWNLRNRCPDPTPLERRIEGASSSGEGDDPCRSMMP
ncbi:MAG: hypothetical protein D6795_15040 [Deltaproteobacteria bacterium]|nr:MAG: hypothetical protein D6795_15040 [Deltaproteobacteria bacterium]